MPPANHRRWTLITVAVIVAGVVFAVAAADYAALQRIQNRGRTLRVGMSVAEVRKVLGEPHNTTTGWFGTLPPDQKLTDVVWSYYTRFDWDGIPGFSESGEWYWWSRFSPRRDSYDDILDVWFRDGKLIGVTIPREGAIVE